MVSTPGHILAGINSPDDLKQLSTDQLNALCAELRHFIIENGAHHPGHLGANLGVIELTLALHFVFNTPYDRIIWDVGHQAYAHKILTGRRDVFHTNRQLNGISGFPRMSESEYDCFGTGHSSTSISAALGMAMASALKGETDRQHIAVIGDGSMTAGMAYEAMNHAGAVNSNVLVILNDNGIAIDKNVGALKNYFSRITASHSYNRFKRKTWRVFRGTWFHKFVNKTATAIKWTFLKRSNLFEAFNFRYFGPVDGHDMEKLVAMLIRLRDIPGPKVLHVLTTKGKGFAKAESDQVTWHAPGRFDSETGEILDKECPGKQPPKYQHVFGKTLLDLAMTNDKIFGITPAMPSGSSLNIMMAKFPNRAVDVGIAEQHAVTFAAGLAQSGLIPFCAIYSSFLQRSYDQIVHDVALQKLPVVFCIDRAGIVGEDGATHQGALDIAFLLTIPNMVISAPIDELDLRNLMFTAQSGKHGPFAIRYPRGRGVHEQWQSTMHEVEIGKADCLRKGENIAVLTTGTIGNHLIQLYDQLDKAGIAFSHYHFRFIKPLDEEALKDICAKHTKVLTIEDGTTMGGFGSQIASYLMANHHLLHFSSIGIPDHFIEHGSPDELYKMLGMDAEGIFTKMTELNSN